MTGKRRIGRAGRGAEEPVVRLAERLGERQGGLLAPPGGTPTTVVARASRLERRLERQRRQRRRRLLAAGVVALLVVLAAVVALAGSVGHDGNKHAAGAGRTQRTLLLQLRGSSGAAIESALLAHDPATGQGVVVLIPSRVIADIPGHGSAPFGNASALGGAKLPQETLTDLMGVTVDGAWVLDGTAMAALIDRLGGVVVDKVDVDVLAPAKGGGSVVLVPHGSDVRLSGASAVAFATYLAPGEQEPFRLARLQSVLSGLLAALPVKPAQLATTIRALGPGSSTTLDATGIATLLVGLAADSAANDLDAETLPVKAIDTGGPMAYGIDAEGLKALVSTSLAGSVPPGLLQGSNRVLVKNGVGTPGIGETVRAKLVAAGFRYIGGGNVPGFTFRDRPSVVLIFDAGDAAQRRGQAVAKALGLPASAVQLSTRGQSVADVIVVVGKNYQP